MNLTRNLQRVFVPILLTLCAGLIAVSSPADSPPVSPASNSGTNYNGARIAFATNTFNFGTIKQGESVKHDFIFTNTGIATLEILDVKPGCGCTTAGTWDKRVELGKTGIIPLQFNSTGFGGQVGKSATVTCNDSNLPTVYLQLTGNVWKPVDVTPTMAMFNFSADDQAGQTKTLKILSNLEDPIQITNVVCNNDAFKTELSTVKEGKEFELRVTATPPFKAPTVFGNVLIKTSSPKSPSLSVTVYAVVQPVLQAFPQQVTLPRGPLTNAFTSQLILRNNSTNLMRLSEPKVEIEGAEARIQETQPGRQFTLHMTFPSGLQLTPGTQPYVMVKTDSTRQPDMKIPVVQTQPIAAVPSHISPPPAASPKVSSTIRTVPTRVAVPAATK